MTRGPTPVPVGRERDTAPSTDEVKGGGVRVVVVGEGRRVLGPAPQLQPLVLPQDGQAWHEPARCICTPHCMQ
jgi:hypothetical protein